MSVPPAPCPFSMNPCPCGPEGRPGIHFRTCMSTRHDMFHPDDLVSTDARMAASRSRALSRCDGPCDDAGRPAVMTRTAADCLVGLTVAEAARLLHSWIE